MAVTCICIKIILEDSPFVGANFLEWLGTSIVNDYIIMIVKSYTDKIHMYHLSTMLKKGIPNRANRTLWMVLLVFIFECRL